VKISHDQAGEDVSFKREVDLQVGLRRVVVRDGAGDVKNDRAMEDQDDCVPNMIDTLEV